MKKMPILTYRYAAIAFSVGALLVAVLVAEEHFFAWAFAVGLGAGTLAAGLSILSLKHGRWVTAVAPVVAILSYKALVQPDPGMNLNQACQFLGGIFIGAAVAGAISTYALRRRPITHVVDNTH